MTTTRTATVVGTAQQHVKARRYDAAVRLLAAHLEQNPCDVEALNTLGLAYFQLGRFTDARSAYLQMWSTRPADHRATFGTGMAMLRLGDLDDAEHWFRATLALEPEFDRAAVRLRELPAARAAAAPRRSAEAAAAGGTTRGKLTTLSLPDNDDDVDTYRRTSRERARIDTMNQHWYGIPWPIRVVQVGGIAVAFYMVFLAR